MPRLLARGRHKVSLEITKVWVDEMSEEIKKENISEKKIWIGLSAPEVQECYDLNPARFASRIEAKLKEKNT